MLYKDFFRKSFDTVIMFSVCYDIDMGKNTERKSHHAKRTVAVNGATVLASC